MSLLDRFGELFSRKGEKLKPYTITNTVSDAEFWIKETRKTFEKFKSTLDVDTYNEISKAYDIGDYNQVLYSLKKILHVNKEYVTHCNMVVGINKLLEEFKIRKIDLALAQDKEARDFGEEPVIPDKLIMNPGYLRDLVDMPYVEHKPDIRKKLLPEVNNYIPKPPTVPQSGPGSFQSYQRNRIYRGLAPLKNFTTDGVYKQDVQVAGKRTSSRKRSKKSKKKSSRRKKSLKNRRRSSSRRSLRRK